ncbi:hypothetical protein M1P56_35980 (plasmid) [Streptomyces sp. HU2014]|uniref:hypothetical protein n=1 Tax=Streptomyces sp. HU2014 TaxID=2939414 RepID=UPI00200F3736|nr:hypothetical protein [Streptomyces sp. HU2014]UQI49804.1 hypothetical protein M1P56_35980 [Streptomyces sp. HU2014]
MTALDSHPVPTAVDVFRHAAEQATRAAAVLWPGEPVRPGPHIPSVTSYVQQIRVGDRDLYAKISYLGVSLASVLRGTCGDWKTVRAAQAAYLTAPDALLQREAAQLGLLHHHTGLRVAQVEGIAAGVLFTRPVPGPTLADLVSKDPHRTADLMTRAVRQVDQTLSKPSVTLRLPRLSIRERSIDTTFTRKFNGLSGRVYLDLVGETAAVLAAVVARLRRAHFATPSGALASVVTYGDLKPEHVIFPHDSGGWPVFIDPGLTRGRAASDEAKLLSRTVLGLLTSPPGEGALKATVEGIDAFVRARTETWRTDDRAGWLRQLVVLWLMDSVNILTTYLTAPPQLPLPEHGLRITTRATAVCTVLDRVSTALEAQTEPHAVWRLALGAVTQEATR